MTRSAELIFLRDILQKRNVAMHVISPSEPVVSLITPEQKEFMSALPEPSLTIRQYLGNLENTTKYNFSDIFNCHYICFLLPSDEKEELLLIGPYVSEPQQAQALLELGETIGIRPGMQRHFEEYYASLPIIPEGDCFFAMIDTFCEHVWRVSSFNFVIVNKQMPLPALSGRESVREYASPEETEACISLMEKRYAFENELMQAVSLGQYHRVDALTAALNEHPFEMRTADPLRNAKNYSIIINTLLRKSAEKGGVHPLYLDGISSRFSELIEKSSSLKDSVALMKEMFAEYCQLVSKHSMKKFSPIVQKAALFIDSDLSADLSLHTLAAHQEISPGYLATVFKKETGKTVSGYVWEKRINHAAELLKSTSLQIQTIASHCGIMDVQYFSKSFKKFTGQTPKSYRESARRKI